MIDKYSYCTLSPTVLDQLQYSGTIERINADNNGEPVAIGEMGQDHEQTDDLQQLWLQMFRHWRL